MKLIFIAFFVMLLSSCSERQLTEWNCNRTVNYLQDEVYYGIVTEKRIEKYNHGAKVIDLKVLDKRSISGFMASHTIYKGLWENVQIGDTLQKKVGETKIYLKGEKIDTVFTISCEEFLERVKDKKLDY